jgi:hypothetical protein
LYPSKLSYGAGAITEDHLIDPAIALLQLMGWLIEEGIFVMEAVMGTLNWIQKWYVKQCNGDWEYSNGVRIDTIDNPGWKVKISVEDTDINDTPFESIDIERLKMTGFIVR